MDDAPLTDNTQSKYSHLRPWRPGESGNLLGRPKGSRNKLAGQFIDDLYADWQQHGAEVITRVREEDPAAYLRTVAQVLPRDLHVEVSAFRDVQNVLEAHRIALSIVPGDAETLQQLAPMIEYDDGGR
jgi:hypothetical protein